MSTQQTPTQQPSPDAQRAAGPVMLVADTSRAAAHQPQEVTR